MISSYLEAAAPKGGKVKTAYVGCDGADTAEDTLVKSAIVSLIGEEAKQDCSLWNYRQMLVIQRGSFSRAVYLCDLQSEI